MGYDISMTEDFMNIFIYVLLGLTAGALSGILGIGGGIIVIPALVFFFSMPQLTAQGTTLAMMLPPIGLLAAWTYYRHGYVDVTAAAFICAGFLIGGLFGAKLAVALPGDIIKKIFGIFLFAVSLRMIFFK